MSMILKFTPTSFQLKILDYLKIRDLVEIAQQQSQNFQDGQESTLLHTMLNDNASPRSKPLSSPDSKRNMMQKPLAYDAPERIYVNQKDIGLQADVWSLGVVLYEFLVSSDYSNDQSKKKAIDSIEELRQINYEARVELIKSNISDVAMKQLLCIMLRDHETRPTAEILKEHPTLKFFKYIVQQDVSLDNSEVLMELSQNQPEQIIPAFVSALQLGNKNKAIVSFFTLMRTLMEAEKNKTNLEEYTFRQIIHQQAYIQIIELLVICMKEYSVSQSTYLAPQGRDQFADFYTQALSLLVRTLEEEDPSSWHTTSAQLLTPASLRKQFYLAGFLSLTMLICEQINRISMKTSEPIMAQDEEFLSQSLRLLGQFVEQTSFTALIAAENAGLVTNLCKMLEVRDEKSANHYMSKECRADILRFIMRIACLMPVKGLRQIGQIIAGPLVGEALMHAPAFQMSKSIFKRYVLEILAQSLVKQNHNKASLDVSIGSNDLFSLEKAVMQLIYFCSIQKSLKLANMFRVCTESLKLTQDLKHYGLSIKYDYGYTCLTCTKLLQGLTHFSGPRVLTICYSCAQACHSKHKIEPTGYLGKSWPRCRCSVVQGFQVNTRDDGETRPDQSFHSCKTKYEKNQESDSKLENNCQPQLLLDPKYLSQERLHIQANMPQAQRSSYVRRSDQISVIDTSKQSDQSENGREIEQKASQNKDVSSVYTTESFDVVSICSSEPFVVFDDSKSGLQTDNNSTGHNVIVSNQSSSFVNPSTQKSGLLSSKASLNQKQKNHTNETNTPSNNEVPAGLERNSSFQNQQNHASDSQNNHLNKPLITMSESGNQDSEVKIEQQPELIKAYFEVKVILGGFFDQVAVGLTVSQIFPVEDMFVGYMPGSIGFHGDDGKCYINGEGFEYSSPYSSQSVIGCGLTVNSDIFFTRDGYQLPLIKSSSVWPNLEQDNLAKIIYPVVSFRGKLATVRVNFRQSEDFVFRTPHQNLQTEHPVFNVCMEQSLVKIVALDLPKNHIQAILESLKNLLSGRYSISSDPQQSNRTQPQKLMTDFFNQLVAIRTGIMTSASSNSKNSCLQAYQSTNLRSVQDKPLNLNLYGQSQGPAQMLQTSAYQKLMPKTTTNKVQSSKIKFHYPQTSTQQQFNIGNSNKQRSLNRDNNNSRQLKSTLSPASRLKQTSSLSQLHRPQQQSKTVVQSQLDYMQQTQSRIQINNNESLVHNQSASRQQLQNQRQRKRMSATSSQGNSIVQRAAQNSNISIKNNQSMIACRDSSIEPPQSVGTNKRIISKTKREQQQHSQLSILNNSKQSTNNRLTSSIEQHHSKDRLGYNSNPQSQFSGVLKGSRSTTNLGPSNQHSYNQNGSKTALKRPYGPTNNGMVHSFSGKQIGGAPSGHNIVAKAAVNQSQQFNRRNQVTVTSVGSGSKRLQAPNTLSQQTKQVKNQQQLILIGSGSAVPNNNSLIGGNSVCNLTKQGSQESIEVQMSFIEGPSQQSNFNSAQNPSSFYANNNNASQEHSQSLKNLRAGGLTESMSNSSLITGPKKSLIKPNTKMMNQTASLTNLMVHQKEHLQRHNYYSQQQQQQQQLLGISNQDPHETKSSHQHQSQQLQQQRPICENSDYVDQPISLRGTLSTPSIQINTSSTNNMGARMHLQSAIYLENQSQSPLMKEDEQAKLSSKTGRQNQQILQSITSTSGMIDQQQNESGKQHAANSKNTATTQAGVKKNGQKSNPGAFYQAYTNQAQTIPRNGEGKKSSTSRAEGHNQVSKPNQNISSSVSMGLNDRITKAHTIKASYVKVPKPRLSSAMSMKQNNSTFTGQKVAFDKSARAPIQSQVKQIGDLNEKPAHHTMKPSQSQKILKNAVVESAQFNQKVNFYPKLATNLDISVPSSDLSKSMGQSDAIGKASARFSRYKDDSNLLDKRIKPQDDGDLDSQQAKNCSIF